jgi:hypothetical protein
MGRYYTGDIEGKLWFGVQSSDDADFFGVESEYVYSLDYDGNEPISSKEPTELSYSFTKEDLEGVEEGLDTCREKLGSYLYKLDDFFRREDGYSKDQLARELGVTKDEAMGLLKWYARYELGKKIRWSIQANGQCNFTCEL